MKGYHKSSFALSVLMYASSALAQTSIPIPTGRAITVDDVLLIGQSMGGFLLIAGGILAGITIIVTGIRYFTAGSNTQKLASAKGMFKAGIIGALIIFSVGLIINTIRIFASNPLQFFQ